MVGSGTSRIAWFLRYDTKYMDRVLAAESRLDEQVAGASPALEGEALLVEKLDPVKINEGSDAGPVRSSDWALKPDCRLIEILRVLGVFQ